MQLSSVGASAMQVDEHLELDVYNKDGHPTVGFGHTGNYLDGSPVTMGQTITKDEAAALFLNDVRFVVDRLNGACAVNCVVLKQCQFDSLVSLLFNVGTGILSPQHSLGQAFAAQDIEKIGAAILLYKFCTLNGVQGPWLEKRRVAEYAMFNWS